MKINWIHMRCPIFIYRIGAGQAVLKPFLTSSDVWWKLCCSAKRHGAQCLRLTHFQRFREDLKGILSGGPGCSWVLERLQVCTWLYLLEWNR